MCLAQGPQRSDAGEARTRGPSVSSQALYHWATALPKVLCARCGTNCIDSWYLPSSLLFTRVSTHKKYRILCYPLRSNSGWLPIRCAYFILTHLVVTELPMICYNLSTALKVMFCSIVLSRRITCADSEEGPETPPPPLKKHKNTCFGFLSNTGPDPPKITKLSSQHSMLGHHRHASNTPWLFAGGPIWILHPSSTKKTLSKLDPLWQNRLDPRMDNYN